MSNQPAPKMGPQPTLLSRKEIDALYETFEAIIQALKQLDVDYIVTGGSLLGAIRQHSILFCDDDIDIAIIETKNKEDDDDESTCYSHVRNNLQSLLGGTKGEYIYQVRPWEGGDRIRHKRMNNVFVDLFVLRRFENMQDLKDLIGVKKNGKPQSEEYVNNIINTIETSAFSQNEQAPLFPCWQFNTRKAIEMWPKEVYREYELFPLEKNLNFGPLTKVQGPRTPVLLLKRAFGCDCFEVYYQSASHQKPDENKMHRIDSTEDLPPLTSAGGTWEGGTKATLDEEHYIPMQPISRAARRPTLHNKERLFEYLRQQSETERSIIQAAEQNRFESTNAEEKIMPPRRTVYMDGVFDLFHVGHLEAIQQCTKLGDRVIIGVTGDADASDYKRPPIISEQDRTKIAAALQNVDQVICPCPLIVTESFMQEHGIDLVVHGFANDADAERQNEFFEIPMKIGKFQRISYYEGLSTTDIMRKIRSLCDSGEDTQEAPKSKKETKWFSHAVLTATGGSSEIPYDPIPLSLRNAIDPHIEKARQLRKKALHSIRRTTGASTFDKIIEEFKTGPGIEGSFTFDTTTYPILSTFLKCTGQPTSVDLSQIHLNSKTKDSMLYSLTQNATQFQELYDKFVTDVCAPYMASIVAEGCEELYYQSFPCVRMNQPNEFSIGPHADVAYGHHPCTVNFYVPMTYIGGTSSVFLETRPGSEDWHPIEGEYGWMKHFGGAICAHWTTENKTGLTRASLDFRLIDGRHFKSIVCESSELYNSNSYYTVCRKIRNDKGDIEWKRDAPLMPPDAKMGFPWTVKNWEKFWSKQNRAS